MPTYHVLSGYWSSAQLATNGIILLHIVGALLLGLAVGYERSYHGRAAGMRTYGLVCMASCALTVIAGFPHHWFGGNMTHLVGTDPTRVIQGIVTGIGFLGAGVIMREGFNISGLTTAASLWASSAIGVMIGIGFYLGAMGLAFLCAMSMVFLSKVEAWLPSRHAVAMTMRFKQGYMPEEKALRDIALKRGYQIAGGSMMISSDKGAQEWRFVAIALSKRSGASMSELAKEMAAFDGLEGFQLSHARN
ncbi:MgtC/SapB family protein [Pseudoduganella namucuonensis]|uniref:Protein MgtC n=1 Tax=Pseudoduganella namucuonensis TaxID=1035707 RepID=A0A1I7GBI0_9BURK|nr:MgtC/SapB family protein [Pseudoduganella namucuonensis]SFU45711.1 putative Mg2+ transporter-C (MgtC) family protein [Pseudoduganella namucuonensis]